MPRPRKTAIEYFSHDTVHGATMQVLENRWGNDGYAFWFKLLELIGTHNGFFIDVRKPSEWELLTAKTRTPKDVASEILDTLCRLEAIDEELWEDHRVIFCPKFIERISEALKKRKEAEIPSRETVLAKIGASSYEFPRQKYSPSGVSGAETTGNGEASVDSPLVVKQGLFPGNYGQGEFPGQKPRLSGVSVTNNPQRRGKESKGEETKPKKTLEEGESFVPVIAPVNSPESKIRSAFKARAVFLANNYPSLNLTVEEEKCVCHFSSNRLSCDPGLAVIRWAERAVLMGTSPPAAAAATPPPSASQEPVDPKWERKYQPHWPRSNGMLLNVIELAIEIERIMESSRSEHENILEIASGHGWGDISCHLEAYNAKAV